jgi:hypothetical protein
MFERCGLFRITEILVMSSLCLCEDGILPAWSRSRPIQFSFISEEDNHVIGEAKLIITTAVVSAAVHLDNTASLMVSIHRERS